MQFSRQPNFKRIFDPDFSVQIIGSRYRNLCLFFLAWENLFDDLFHNPGSVTEGFSLSTLLAFVGSFSSQPPYSSLLTNVFPCVTACIARIKSVEAADFTT